MTTEAFREMPSTSLTKDSLGPCPPESRPPPSPAAGALGGGGMPCGWTEASVGSSPASRCSFELHHVTHFVFPGENFNKEMRNFVGPSGLRLEHPLET